MRTTGVTVGDVVAAQQDGDFSYRPITIHGRQQETVTLQVTLTDSRTGRPYPLDIPYTLTAEDTQITATFVVGRLRLEKAVPFGQPPPASSPRRRSLSRRSDLLWAGPPVPTCPCSRIPPLNPSIRIRRSQVCSAGAGADNRFAERRPLE